MFWYPTITVTSSDAYFRLLFFLYHYIPAFFVDIVLRWKKSKHRLVEIYSKIFYQLKLFSYFGEHTWTFHDSNKNEIFDLMSEDDHKEFPVIATREGMLPLYTTSMIGICEYFFKQTEEESQKARQKLRIFFFLHYAFLAVVYLSVLWLFHSTISRNVMNSFFAVEESL
jgi:alcohol-forming fatty acyl-CoA reductase